MSSEAELLDRMKEEYREILEAKNASDDSNRVWRDRAEQAEAQLREMQELTVPTRHNMNEDGDLFYDDEEVEQYLADIQDLATLPLPAAPETEGA